ncbi:Uncharacterised protein [Acetobacterium wieringae]|nr:Uncharacterised protein [Acetobacterium wieringae]
MIDCNNPELVDLPSPNRIYKFLRFDKENYWKENLKTQLSHLN